MRRSLCRSMGAVALSLLSACSPNPPDESTGAATHRISGTITASETGAPVPGVAVDLASRGVTLVTTTTDASGGYAVDVANGSYAITPALSGHAFTPARREVTVDGRSVPGQHFSATAAPAASVRLPRTGSATWRYGSCVARDPYGSTDISRCPNRYDVRSIAYVPLPGEDGAVQAGTPWPVPRFARDDAGTLVTDHLTGLMWDADATMSVSACNPAHDTVVTQDVAAAYVLCLNSARHRGYADWRLPTVRELRSLVSYGQLANDYGEAFPARVGTSLSWLYGEYHFGRASGLAPSQFWSSTGGWYVDLDRGLQYRPSWGFAAAAWPVRSGDGVAAAPAAVPRTGRDQPPGVPWPAPRFSAVARTGGSVVRDHLTGLVWAGDAGTPTVPGCLGGQQRLAAALDHVACLNRTGYLGYDDWRVPNVNELESLVDYSASRADGALLPGDHPFTNVRAASHELYLTSTVAAVYVGADGSHGRAFYTLGLRDAWIRNDVATGYVWPVRGGP